MTIRTFRKFLGGLAAFCLLSLPLAAVDMPISVVQFPEGSGVDLKMAATARVAPAEAEASVKFKDGQASVEVEYKKLPPAILFGADVTSYVVWAISRDGRAENLGELIVLDSSGSGNYRTGQKEFALMVTAEPYNLVLRPSELVCFTSLALPPKKGKSTQITFSGFVPPPAVGNPQIGSMKYTGSEPVEIVQAQHVLDQARAMGAEKYAPDSIRDAGITLAQAQNSFKGGNKKVGTDYARRSLSLSSTAIRDTQKNLAQEAAAAAAAKRAAEMQALEQSKVQAQQQAAAAEQQTLAAREAAVAAREQALAARSSWPSRSSSSTRPASRRPRRSRRCRCSSSRRPWPSSTRRRRSRRRPWPASRPSRPTRRGATPKTPGARPRTSPLRPTPPRPRPSARPRRSPRWRPASRRRTPS